MGIPPTGGGNVRGNHAQYRPVSVSGVTPGYNGVESVVGEGVTGHGGDVDGGPADGTGIEGGRSGPGGYG